MESETPLISEPIKKRKSATEVQIRGSSLLLVGKLLSRGINMLVDVLIVRHLTQADFGAFAYALSVVTIVKIIATFGMDRAVTRFVPIYQEQKDYRKMFGTVAMVFGFMITLGLAMALLLNGFRSYAAEAFISEQQALALLLIMIFLAPVQAVDESIIGLFAVFASPKAIFFRKNIFGPLLKLGVVLLLIAGGGNVFILAWGQLGIGIVVVLIYILLLVRLLRPLAARENFSLRSMVIPWREVLPFTIPLLSSDLMYLMMNQMDVIMLKYFQGVLDVASLRAIQPIAKMNQTVLISFGLLFTPLAARMFARGDRKGINGLYWHNAIWIAVASFPIFALTFSLAKPITVLFFEERYADSAVFLALLSFGYYFNAALGQNGLTLKVYGKLRYSVTLNIAAGFANLGINYLLIPRYGALGAAIGTTSTLVLHNIFKQAGLRLGTGISVFDPKYRRVYGIIIVAALSVGLVQTVLDPPVYVSIGLAGVASILVFRLNRHLLNVEETFPELLRLPLMRWLLG
ncbi:MAG: flippase [Candidatus Promineifilaceae bacterium]|nr:flippase [Candidatus Promineifilaceae bacterium]